MIVDGASRFSEGVQDVHHGNNRILTTQSVNPLRDWVFAPIVGEEHAQLAGAGEYTAQGLARFGRSCHHIKTCKGGNMTRECFHLMTRSNPVIKN